MSANSSDKETRNPDFVVAPKKVEKSHKKKTQHAPKRQYRWSMLLIIPVWVLIAFIVAQALLAAVLWILKAIGISLLSLASQTVIETTLAALVYLLALVITFGVPYMVKKRKISLTALGIDRLPSWADIGLAPLGFIAYALLTAALIYIATTYIPGFPSGQAQDVGFKSLTNRTEMLLAFLTLVVIAPIAEEVLFRGYLYGKLRKYTPLIPSILVTSLLFGAVHMQWNVGLDTFALSIIMCCLREVSGSIWAGVLLHMTKNAVAFYLLFMMMPGIGS